MPYLEQLFKLPAGIRKCNYTLNFIKSVNPALRKITIWKTSFPNEASLYKVMYVRIWKLSKKWKKPIKNWEKIVHWQINSKNIKGKNSVKCHIFAKVYVKKFTHQTWQVLPLINFYSCLGFALWIYIVHIQFYFTYAEILDAGIVTTGLKASVAVIKGSSPSEKNMYQQFKSPSDVTSRMLKQAESE